MAASRPHEFRLLMGCGDGCDNLGRGELCLPVVRDELPIAVL